MKIHRIFIPITFLAFLFAFSIKPAQAHAYLATSSPEFNAALDKTPSLVELVFTEAIEANFSKVEVLDLEGNRVDNDDSTVDPANPTRMTVTVRSLVDGIYTVSWKTLSLVDSHITAGAFPFSVGDVDPEAMAAAARASTQTTLSFGEVIFRWLSYLSSSAFIGGVLFVMTVWQPAYQAVNDKIEKTPPLSPPWRKLAVFSLFLLVAANILGLLSQTGQLVDQEIAAPWNPAINRLLFGTKYGMFWMVRFVMALIIARFLLNAKTKRDWWISFAATLVILVTFSFNSHAAAEPQWVLPISADWVHLVGASAWIGGLIYFIGGLWTIRETDPSYRTRLTAALIPRFSALAAVSVGIIGLTGIYSAYLRIGTYENLIGTLYGKVLIVKILLALPMFLLGATNLLRTSPSMRKAEKKEQGNVSLIDRFRKLVSGEVFFAILLLLSVGIFTALPPARAVATDTTIRDAADADDLYVEIEISPGNIGINTFTIRVTASGKPVENVSEVSLQFSPTTVELPPSGVVLEETGNSEYSAEGAFLSMPDNWQVQAAIRREGEFDAFANFDIPFGTTASQFFPWNQVNSGLLLVGALMYLLALQMLDQTKKQQLYATRLPAIALVVSSIFIFRLPPSLAEQLVNPIPPNRDSIATGQALYRIHCLACHGSTGRGDGPVGLTLNPPPADLYEHTQPGVHPDGRLWGWITNGFGEDSMMPAFKETLTDDERWHMINYIRTFSREFE